MTLRYVIVFFENFYEEVFACYEFSYDTIVILTCVIVYTCLFMISVLTFVAENLKTYFMLSPGNYVRRDDKMKRNCKM